jgi:hypothetical protein
VEGEPPLAEMENTKDKPNKLLVEGYADWGWNHREMQTQERSMSSRWIEQLQEKIANCWEWHSPALQIGFQYATPVQGDDCWEIWVYPAVQEIVGGKEDGETVWSGFHFDVLQFLRDFEPEAVGISTRLHVHPPELTFEGKFRGKSVFLHLCLQPPEDAEAAEIVDFSGSGGAVVREKE